jgi:hypothetical protein
MKCFIKIIIISIIISLITVVKASTNNESINLAVVACGDRVPETLTLLKSALMFTETKLNFYIITDDSIKKTIFINQVIFI